MDCIVCKVVFNSAQPRLLTKQLGKSIARTTLKHIKRNGYDINPRVQLALVQLQRKHYLMKFQNKHNLSKHKLKVLRVLRVLKVLKVLRVLRVLRILKILKVLRFSSVFKYFRKFCELLSD